MSDFLANQNPFNHAAGVINTNNGQGQQTNLTQDGSNNWQVNAQTANIQVSSIAAPAEYASTSSTVLPRHDPHFVNRQALLKQIEERASIPGNWLALVGLGGVGKTQLATKYVKSVRETKKDIWILWIFASHAVRFDESVRDIADQLKLPQRDDPQSNVLQLLQIWLAESSRRWLIVLDNSDDTAFLDDPPATADSARSGKPRIDYLQHGEHGTVLLTSRSKDEALRYVSEDNIIDVDKMDAEHAKQVLKSKLASLYDETGAEALAAALDYMPLALSQAASFILQKKRTYSISRYLSELEKSRESRTNLLRQHGVMPRRDRDASSSIILTWQISFEHIHRERKSAADLLALMSFCDRQVIPQFLLLGKQQVDDDSAEQDSSFDDDIQMLEDFSFISTAKDSCSTFEMHRLVQDATQWWLTSRDKVLEIEQVFISHLHAVMPNGQFGTWDICRLLMPHIEAAVQLQLTQEQSRLERASVLFKAAWFQGVTGRLQYADDLAFICLKDRVDLLGEDHSDTLETRNGIASLRVLQGRFREAEDLALHVQRSRKKMQGDDDPIALENMHNLATSYWKQARLVEAEALAREVLAKRIKLFTEEHSDTISTMTLLALCLSHQGRLDEAKALQTKTCDISKKILGEDDPGTLTQMNNLALTLLQMKQFHEAEEIQTICLSKNIKVLGEDHHQTLLSMGNLAVILTSLGRTDEAAKMQNAVLVKREGSLSKEHPDTLTSMSLVAIHHFENGRWSEAAALQEIVLETRKRILGIEHPGTLRVMVQLARTRIHQLRGERSKQINQTDAQEETWMVYTLAELQEDLDRTLMLMYSVQASTHNRFKAAYMDAGEQ